MKCFGLAVAIALAVAALAGARVADASPVLKAPNLKLVSTTSTFESCSNFVSFSNYCALLPDAIVVSSTTTMKWNRVPGAAFYFVDIFNSGTIGSPGSAFGYERVSADTMRATVTLVSFPGSTISYSVEACVEGGELLGPGCVQSNYLVVPLPS